MKSIFLGLYVVITFSSYAQAQEPSYCNPTTFYSKEVQFKNNMTRAHLYQLGPTQLMGVAIGNTKTADLINFATTHTADANDKYCTWYLNEGSGKAEAAFNHFYVSNPSGLNTKTGPAEYRKVLQDIFANNPTSFLSCIEKNKYVAMGCNGQKHRGPTVFGMLLAYSGCSPQNAATIVNKVWGLNGVKPEVRLAIIDEGRKLGDADPEARRRIQKYFGY